MSGVVMAGLPFRLAFIPEIGRARMARLDAFVMEAL